MNIFIRTSILFLIIVMLCSCHRNPVERNTIVFEDNFATVQDSLARLKELLAKLPKRSDSLNVNYVIKNEKLYANHAYLHDSDIEFANPYIQFSNSEKRHFYALASFLNKNSISSAYLDESTGLWRFGYRHSAETTFDDLRQIVLLRGDEVIKVKSTDSILDRKERLYLLAPIYAKIR